MDVRSIILGFLMDRRLTGYELRKAFSLSFSFFSGLSYGSIYPALKKMEKEGLITLEVQMQDGAPNRKVYTITEQGRREFMASIREPFPLERQRYGFIMYLFFFSHLAPQERIRLAREHLLSVQKVRGSSSTPHRRLKSTPIRSSSCASGSGNGSSAISSAMFGIYSEKSRKASEMKQTMTKGKGRKSRPE